MFTSKVVIKLNNLELIDSLEIPEILGISGSLDSAWFSILKANVENGNIKDFKFHEWNVETQTTTSLFYSDTADQARAFQHALFGNQDFLNLAEVVQKKGHEFTVDMGMCPNLTLEQVAGVPGYEKIKFTL